MSVVAFGQAPCDAKMYDTLWYENYESVTPLKTFSLHLDSLKSMASTSVVFSQGTIYSLTTGNASYSQTAVKVRVMQGKTLISVNLLEVGKIKIISFEASITGIYQLQVLSKKPSDACVTLALGYLSVQ